MEAFRSALRKRKYSFFLRLQSLRLARGVIACVKRAIAPFRRSSDRNEKVRYAPLLLFLLAVGFPFLSYLTFTTIPVLSSTPSLISPASTHTSTSFNSITNFENDALLSLLASTAMDGHHTSTSNFSSVLRRDFIPAPRQSVQTVPALTQPIIPDDVHNLASQDLTIHLVFVCDVHQPCCDSSVARRSIRAAVSQTLSPNYVTMLRACSDVETDRSEPFLDRARQSVRDHLNQTLYLHHCTTPTTASGKVDMEECLLRYIAFPPRRSAPVDLTTYVVLVTSSMILEPTALESMWLYLISRPKLAAVRPQSYSETSLRDAVINADPSRTTTSIPSTDPHDETPVHTLPLMFARRRFRPGLRHRTCDAWLALSRLMARGRLVRIPLFTAIKEEAHSHDTMLTLRTEHVPRHFQKSHLWSEHAFYKWSARSDASEKYVLPLKSSDEKSKVEVSSWPFRRLLAVTESVGERPRFMFIMPWMQMGGSEKCMLDIAARLTRMNLPISFVFTMPFWHEDPLGELALKHEWIDKAFALTPDVFDIVALTPNEKFSKVLRYLVESRSPDFILTANSRVVYEHLAFIKQVSPQTMITDYNHMVHMDWMVTTGIGGGMPRYGTTYTRSIDLHLAASQNVTMSMQGWMDPDVRAEYPEKVHTCYIGTDPSALHSSVTKDVVRKDMRESLGVHQDAVVVLFAGRYVSDKGIDVMNGVVRRLSTDEALASMFTFVFVGSGELKNMLEATKVKLRGRHPQLILQPPAVGLERLRDYYAMSDIFLLPSVNEGIALVLYEAMAAGLLVMSTDVGGQKELLRSDTGVLLPPYRNAHKSVAFVVRTLETFIRSRKKFEHIQMNGRKVAQTSFTTNKFCECVISHMIMKKRELEQQDQASSAQEKAIAEMRPVLADVMRSERVHGTWNQQQVIRSIAGQVTIGVKTYVCDASVLQRIVGLVKSIRANYKKVRILIGNDGPMTISSMNGIKQDEFTEEVLLPSDSGISFGRNALVNMTTTEYFLLLEDDQQFERGTNLIISLNGLAKFGFDIVGLRVINMPGFVSKFSKLEHGELTFCSWDETGLPDTQAMRVPIRMDVLHNAFIAKTDVLRAHPWRNALKLNEHMTFFLDAYKNNVNVGYLPSVLVHRSLRAFSKCYNSARLQEDKYEHLLDYKGKYKYDVECGEELTEILMKHIERTNK